MRLRWEFRCYVSSKGINEIRAWYDQQSKAVQGTFISRLRILGQCMPEEWRPKPFRWLRHECAGLGEIRFKAGNVQHRPLGFRSDRGQQCVFTFVFCAKEKGGRFVPPNACEIGLDNKAIIQGDARRSCVHDFKLE
jgi:hypothetical protein